MGEVDLSIIVPCYNEDAVINAFFQELKASLAKVGLNWEIVCVNDGSTDATLELLIEQSRQDPRVKIIDLSRNFGKEAALTAGLDRACGRAMIPIDVDLQDPPDLIEDMVAKWGQGYDVVHAVRMRRHGETLLKRVTANLFYRLYNRLTTLPIPPNAGDFRLLDRRVVETLKQMPERNRFMKGLFGWPGFRQTEVRYDRQPRRKGKTTFGYWKLWTFALDGMTSFTTAPLRVWTYIGAMIACTAFLYAVFMVVRTLIYGIDVPGYASLIVVVLFLGGVQLISLGIIGEYIGRIYEEVKERPIYVVNRVYNLDPDVESERQVSRSAVS